MRHRIRALPLAALAAAVVVLAACGGDDSKAERKTRDEQPDSTAAAPIAAVATGTAAAAAGGAATRTLDLNCGDQIKSFRFDGKLALQRPGAGSAASDDVTGLISGLLEDVKFNGAFAAPDRTQMKIDLGGKDSLFGGEGIEFVQIGTTSYIKLGANAWQKQDNAGDGALEDLDPRSFCAQARDSLPRTVQGRKDKVNGVDATRYEYDRKDLEGAAGFFGDLVGGGELPENAKLTMWVAEKEKFPVKMTVAASGRESGQPFSINLEFNVSDLNSSSVRVEAPR